MTPLLDITDLRVHFGPPARPIRAVDGVSLTVGKGETVGLVGESGCGKTTLGRAVLGLEGVASGRVLFDGTDIGAFAARDWRQFRKRAQMVFQDPYGSLNPRMRVGAALEEVLRVHKKLGRAECRAGARRLLETVGMDPSHLDRYPHELSGGQRQRVGIARALAVDPVFIIADEPVSALDVSVQVQILNLLKDLQAAWRLSYLFVAHDLAVVRYMCERLYVMYLGRIVEWGEASAIYARPAHPYTEALLAAVPDVDRSLGERGAEPRQATLKDDVPSADQAIPGCPFHPRCPRVRARCRDEAPALREVRPGRRAACHLAEEVLEG